MITKTFVPISQDTQNTKDIIEVSYHFKSHNATLIIKQIDNIYQHIDLIKKAINYLKENDIKWIIMDIKFKFNIPENTVWFKNKHTNAVHCHVQDFEKFYLQNLSNFVKISPIFINSTNNNDNDGWITVIDKKKAKRNKIAELNRDITKLFKL
jgi:hypothetical protein